jgi:hypothetical protein
MDYLWSMGFSGEVWTFEVMFGMFIGRFVD